MLWMPGGSPWRAAGFEGVRTMSSAYVPALKESACETPSAALLARQSPT
jgi:hypothetical protein